MARTASRGGVVTEARPLPVAVVIPAYQAEETIARAVASVRAQTRPPREIIVVDDGSRDGTARAAARAGARVVRQANGGCAAARNRGILAATSPWIACIDADDEWLPHKLERMWEAIEAAPDVALFGHDFIPVQDGKRLAFSGLGAKPPYWKARRRRIGPRLSVFDERGVACTLPVVQFLCPSTIVATRELLVACPFAERLPSSRLSHIGEDQEWILRAVKRTSLLMLEEPLALYHLQPGSLSSNAGRIKFGDVHFSLLVAAAPDRYAVGAAAALARMRPQRYREAAVAFMRALDFHSARAVVRVWLSESPRTDAMLLLLCAIVGGTSVGTAAARPARAVWRRAIVPAVRALLGA